jgi:perosamine synthetase
MNELAIYKGRPVRQELLPYCAHHIDQDDIDAVVEVLKHGWLTTGPKVQEFEGVFTREFNVNHAVSFSSGTTALLGVINALGIKTGDEVIVPTLTFVASVNCILSGGATPVFCDVSPETLLIDTKHVTELITNRTKAIISVDYAGQPCDYDELNVIAQRHGLFLIADASHSIGARYKNRPVGGLAHVTVFSFHPTKNMTTGEGGMITTNIEEIALRARLFRSHGISKTSEQIITHGNWYYEMSEPGYNYRLSDINCALGISQIKKLNQWVARRNEISNIYRKGLRDIPQFIPLIQKENIHHAYHLFVVKINPHQVHSKRVEIFNALQAEGIGVNVHYMPVHLHPYYQRNYGTHAGLCPVAENISNHLLTLPMFSQMTENDTLDVLNALKKVGTYFSKVH